jgi:hypothetical protein
VRGAKDNTSSMEGSMPPYDPHEECRELCAVSTTGELSKGERARLDEHLAHCQHCRQFMREYEQVVRIGLPGWGSQAEWLEEDAPFDWSIETAANTLMRSLDSKAASTCAGPVTVALPRSARLAWNFPVAALLVGAFSLAGFEIGRLHKAPDNSVATGAAHSSLTLTEHIVPRSTGGKKEAKRQEDAQSATLHSEIRLQEQGIAKLDEQLNERKDQLAQTAKDLKQSREERDQLKVNLTQAEANAQSLETKLSVVQGQSAQDAADLLALKVKVGELSAAVTDKDQQIAHQQDLLAHDRDIRNLVGARDLYIAEVYDVDKSGNTQKPFGRVFYTKNKSLVFYGYDLDQQSGIKRETSFQAWGRRDSDGNHDVSLGLFYQDDTSQRRWVLKFNDAKTISGLDAVFVTVEPEGGSAKPSGKPLLFTYLRLDPNHP